MIPKGRIQYPACSIMYKPNRHHMLVMFSRLDIGTLGPYATLLSMRYVDRD